MKIKKGDNIIVIAGKDRGKKGKVLKAMPKKSMVIVEGINVSKRHSRPSREGQKGQVVEKTMPIHVSNVMREEGGKRVRNSKK